MLNFLFKKPSQVFPKDPLSQGNFHVGESKHLHQWELVIKTYGTRSNVYGQEKFTSDLTTLLWQCKLCDQFHKEELIGSDEPQLSELVSKAQTYGQQVFRHNEEVFVISKYIPPVVQSGYIPVK